MSMSYEEYVRACQEWLARRKAWIDQKEKQFEDQYPMIAPDLNRRRFEDLEAWKFVVEVHEWELEEYIKKHEESEDE